MPKLIFYKIFGDRQGNVLSRDDREHKDIIVLLKEIETERRINSRDKTNYRRTYFYHQETLMVDVLTNDFLMLRYKMHKELNIHRTPEDDEKKYVDKISLDELEPGNHVLSESEDGKNKVILNISEDDDKDDLVCYDDDDKDQRLFTERTQEEKAEHCLELLAKDFQLAAKVLDEKYSLKDYVIYLGIRFEEPYRERIVTEVNKLGFKQFVLDNSYKERLKQSDMTPLEFFDNNLPYKTIKGILTGEKDGLPNIAPSNN